MKRDISSEFEQITAYKCKYCGKIVRRMKDHLYCKRHPGLLNCRDCKNYEHIEGYMFYPMEEPAEWVEPCHRCNLGLAIYCTRHRECAGYNETDEVREMRVLRESMNNGETLQLNKI